MLLPLVLFVGLVVFLLGLGVGLVALSDVLAATNWRERCRSFVTAIFSLGVSAAIVYGFWLALASIELPVPN